jgi:hypothetical protein
MNRIKPSHIFWGALVAGVLLRLIIIFQPESDLLTRWGSDDLYYYSQIAGHVANGDGFTFDGIHDTNGFQPLFLAALVPFGSFMLHDWQSAWVIVSLVVTAFSVLTFFQLRKFSKEMGWSDWLSVLLPAVFILHPKILSVTFNGTEGALSFFILVLCLRAFYWMQNEGRFWQSMLVFSLLVITRMEFSLFLFFLFVFAMLKGQSMIRWMKVAVGPILTFGLWLLINYLCFGNIMPSSGQAKSIHAAWYNFSVFDGFIGAWGAVLYAESAVSWVVIGLSLIGLFAIISRRDKRMIHLGMLLAVVSSILIWMALVRLHGFRDWYLVPEYLLMLLLVAFGIEWFVRSKKTYVLLLPFFMILLWGEAQFAPRKFNGQFIIRTCEDVKKLVAKGERIGVFNAGLPSACLGRDYPVVNLDGVVNNSVLPYLQENSQSGYLKFGNVRYLLDNNKSLEFFKEKAFGLGYSGAQRLHVFYEYPDVWYLEQVWF